MKPKTTTEKQLIELSHKYKMEEIEREFELKRIIETLHNQHELERMRIKTAEIRKDAMRRSGY